MHWRRKWQPTPVFLPSLPFCLKTLLNTQKTFNGCLLAWAHWLYKIHYFIHSFVYLSNIYILVALRSKHCPAAATAVKSLQSFLTLCDPIDSSPPASPVPGILQARTLEWVAISFSNAWKWKVKVKSLSRVRLLATQWTADHQAPPPMGFTRQEYWSGVPLSSPKHCPSFCEFMCSWVHDIMWVFPSFLNEYVSENWCADRVIFKRTKGAWYLWEFLRKIILLCGRPFYKESCHILTCLLYKPVFPYVSFSSTGIPPVF